MTDFQPMASRGSELSSLLPFKVTLEDTCSQKQLEGDKELVHPHKATRAQWTAGPGGRGWWQSVSTRSLGRQQTARDNAGEWRETGAAGKDGVCCELGVSSLTREAVVRLMSPRRRPQAHSQEWREVTGGKPGGVEWLVPREDTGTGSGRGAWASLLGCGPLAPAPVLTAGSWNNSKGTVLPSAFSGEEAIAGLLQGISSCGDSG